MRSVDLTTLIITTRLNEESCDGEGQNTNQKNVALKNLDGNKQFVDLDISFRVTLKCIFEV
jgi:hypothetical protein